MSELRKLSFAAAAAVFAGIMAAPAGAQPEEPAPAAGEPVAEEVAPADGAVDPALGDVAGGEAFEAPIVEVTTEEVHNPYGLSALWSEGDLVARSALIIMALMSVISWQIFITKFFSQSGILGQAKAAQKRFAAESDLREGVSGLPQKNAFRRIAEEGLDANEHHRRHIGSKVPQYEWVAGALRRAVDDFAGGLQGGTAFVATVGSIAPFVGLFGTVWGILQALISIGVAGQASIDKVAGPVGEALIMTAIGLAVAVPAVGFYNILVRRNRQIVDSARHFADGVLGMLISENSSPKKT